MNGINNNTTANPLALFETALQAHPNAERLVLKEREGTSFIQAPASFFGNPIEFCLRLGSAKTESQKLGERLRQSLEQKYGKTVAEIACPPIVDESDWNASKIDHALNMARIVAKNPDAYMKGSLATKRDEIAAYAKDTAMVIPHAHEEAFDRMNEFRTVLNASRKTKAWEARKAATIACVNDPTFMAAREAATKAALHATQAVRAAETFWNMAQKIASSDSSYGAAIVLKTATAHFAATKEAEIWASFAKNHYSRYIETNDGLYGGISDLELRNAIDAATVATWTAADAYDAYAIYAATRESTIDVAHASAIAEAATARSTVLDMAMQDIEATIKYASALEIAINHIDSAVSSSDVTDRPLMVATRNMRLAVIYIKTVTQEATLCCAEEKLLAQKAQDAAVVLHFSEGLERSSSEAKAAVKIISDASDPCRIAAIARMMAALSRATKRVEHAAKVATEIVQKTRRELYRAGYTDKDLDAIEEAEKTYRNDKDTAITAKRIALSIERL